jgi:hypothetical protein
MKAVLAAIALVALSAAPALADDVIRDQWIAGYCSYHPDDPDCAARGYHWTASDPVDQAVDRRLNERFCAGHPTLARCVSPFAPPPSHTHPDGAFTEEK